MDSAKVAMIAATSGLYELPPDIEALVDTEEFWQGLAATPEDQLNEEQLRVLQALGVPLDRDL